MPELKAKAGSSRSVRGCIAYLTRNGRDIASDYINCSEIDEEEHPVWKQMDEVRFLAGNDRMDENHGCAAPRTFEHFIISPDPRDCVDLNTLQALCKAWVGKYFGEYQAAIYYHDDNQGRIPHAHIVINNTNIRTRGRITTLLTKGYCRRMNDGLQDMARAMGLSAFESTASRSEKRVGGPVPATIQDVARTREELAIIDAGAYSWKEDIRQRLRCAVKLSWSSEEFLVSCSALGLGVREDKKGEWVFSLASHPTWQVSGRKIGFDFSRYGIERWLARDRALGRRKIGAEAAEHMRDAIASSISAGGSTPSILGVIDVRRYTAKDVADMLDLCEDLDIRSMDDFHDASVGPMAAEAREELRASWRLARDLGHLPEHRQSMDGERLRRKRASYASGTSAYRQGYGYGSAVPNRTNSEIPER